MDYDADGDLDILSGSYTGELYLFERNQDETFSQGTPILDENGDLIEVAMSVTPEAVDMDGDGDLDLVVGTRMAGVFVIENLGSRAVPRWSAEKSQLQTVTGREIKGSNAHHADWDGDGVRDLIVGSEYGQVLWYRNVGQNDAPRYEMGGELLPKSPFNQPEEGTMPVRSDGRVKLHVADWNGDGLADLLAGDVAWQYELTVPLTPEETQEKAALEPGYKEILNLVGASSEEWRKFREADQPIPADFQKRRDELIAEMSAYGQKMRKFDRNKSLNTHGWVWLYLRKAESSVEKELVPLGMDFAGPVAVQFAAEDAAPGEIIELRVTFDISEGWHIYGDMPETSPFPATEVKLELPDGITAVGEWKLPEAQVNPDSSQLPIYTGAVTFVRELVVTKPALVEIEVSFQACDENNVCLPLATLQHTLLIR